MQRYSVRLVRMPHQHQLRNATIYKYLCEIKQIIPKLVEVLLIIYFLNRFSIFHCEFQLLTGVISKKKTDELGRI